MRTVAIALVLCLGCKDKNAEPPVAVKTAAPASASEVTEAAYAALLIAELKKQGGDPKLHFQADKSLITDGERQIATRNLYAEYLKLAAEERVSAVERTAKSFSELTPDSHDPALAEVRSKLLPAVRAGLYFDFDLQSKLDKPATESKDRAVFVKLGEVTGAGVAIDQEASMMIATSKQLEKWNISVEDALAIATENLAAKGTPFQSVQPGLWTSPAHDNYDSSRILLLEEIKKLGLKGTVVAMIPNRDTLYLAGSQDAAALLAMADLAEKASEEPRPIHTVPLCLSGTTWSDCEPGPTPEVKTRMHAMATMGRQSLYAEQKDLLQEKLGEEVFVASYTVLQDKGTSRLVSYATWSRTVPTLLPKADRIGFVEYADGSADAKPKVLGMVPWDKAMQILGTRLKPDGRNPPRWATGEYWPSKAELARLAPAEDPFK
ncbi:MAG: hypothetical protein H0T46_07430 [Deltaproteobacteria bacterium]|nr:hypothetical protein [Deltaproteobacteria bacterium]